MSAGIYNITVEQGATFAIKLRLKDSLGAFIDLTNRNFTGQIRKSVTFADAVATFAFTKATPQTGDNLGVVNCTISAAGTLAIPVPPSKDFNTVRPVYVYDIYSTDASGFVERWLQGQATISPGVTRV